jgi:subtilisin
VKYFTKEGEYGVKLVGYGLIIILLLLIGGTMFTDVSKDLNSYEAIKNLKDAGWIVGVGNNEYKPFDSVTRAEMAVFICRATFGVHYKPNIPVNTIPDVPADYWGAKWIGVAVTQQIMDLYPDGNFYPRNPATRADIAVLVDLLK